MNSLNKQRGLATLLMVILLGITVMAVTAAVAKNINSKKEATVAAHAQTNAQMMAWAGVSAFQQYLINAGSGGVTNITGLNGTSVTLRNDTNQVIANNIKVSGPCTTNGDICNVSADISANDISAQAATTINAVYTMKITNGTVQITPQNATFSFGGNTTFSGNVALNAAVPNSTLTLAVNGDLNIPAQGLITNNISTLNINSTGDVYIDCSITKCGGATINITAHNVTVSDGTNFGTIKASGNVVVGNGVKTTAGDITALGKVNVDTGSTVGNIISQGAVTMTGGSTANSIASQGSVGLYTSTVNGNVESYSTVTVSASTVKGNVNATGNVSLDTSSIITGSVTTSGAATLATSTVYGNVSAQQSVMVYGYSINSTNNISIGGNVYTNGLANNYCSDTINNVNVCNNILGTKIVGTVHLPANGSYGGYGSKANVLKDVPATPLITPNFTVLSGNTLTNLGNTITTSTTTNTHIDVNAYINQANYIFLQSNGSTSSTLTYNINRVYLNQLLANGVTYTATCTTTSSPITCVQYQAVGNGTATQVTNPTTGSSSGFNLGDYTYNGQTYTGAVCLTVNSNNVCTSPIIGYLPRISMSRTLGLTNDYAYEPAIQRWEVRSLSNASTLNNATLAPGIMFFEGDLEIAGHSTNTVDSAFVNSFLTTESIWTDAYSPIIYSPYSVVSHSGTAGLVCNRPLEDVNNNIVSPSATTPTTSSNIYPVPINMCKDANDFAYSMNKNTDSTTKNITIDNTSVPMLDLGTVALMANNNINLGSCSAIYGDILARGEIITSSGCGSNGPQTTGLISTQGQGNGTVLSPSTTVNTIAAGTTFNLPANSSGTPTNVAALLIDPSTSKLVWTKML